MGKEFNNADKGKTFKQGGDMKKGYADGGMSMVNKGGKMVPSFAADGKGKMANGGMTKKMATGGMAKKMATGGATKKMANGGMTSMGAVKTASPSRDGIAQQGKTKGTIIAMKSGGRTR